MQRTVTPLQFVGGALILSYGLVGHLGNVDTICGIAHLDASWCGSDSLVHGLMTGDFWQPLLLLAGITLILWGERRRNTSMRGELTSKEEAEKIAKSAVSAFKAELDSLERERQQELKNQPIDFVELNQQRILSSGAHFALNIAKAEFKDDVLTKINQMRDFNNHHKSDFADQFGANAKAYGNMLRPLRAKLRELGHCFQQHEPGIEEAKVAVAKSLEANQLKDGDQWPTLDAKRNWMVRMAELDAYERIINELCRNTRNAASLAVANSQPLGIEKAKDG